MGKQFLLSGTVGRAAFLAAAPTADPNDDCYFAEWISVGNGNAPLSRQEVRACLDRAPKCAIPMLFGLFTDHDLNLLAVDVLGLGSVAKIRPRLGRLLRRGRSMSANAMLMAYSAQTDDISVGQPTLDYVAQLRRDLEECHLPLLDYLVVGPSRIFGIGSW